MRKLVWSSLIMNDQHPVLVTKDIFEVSGTALAVSQFPRAVHASRITALQQKASEREPTWSRDYHQRTRSPKSGEIASRQYQGQTKQPMRLKCPLSGAWVVRCLPFYVASTCISPLRVKKGSLVVGTSFSRAHVDWSKVQQNRPQYRQYVKKRPFRRLVCERVAAPSVSICKMHLTE